MFPSIRKCFNVLVLVCGSFRNVVLLWSVLECRRVLHSVAEYFRVLQIVEKCFQLLKSVLQCCIELQRFFQSIIKYNRVMRCRAFRMEMSILLKLDSESS